MDEKEVFGAATLLLSRLRRHINRHFDIVWFMQNVEYAREVLRIARSFGDDDITRLAERLEAAKIGTGRGMASAPGGRADISSADPVRYIGGLR